MVTWKISKGTLTSSGSRKNGALVLNSEVSIERAEELEVVPTPFNQIWSVADELVRVTVNVSVSPGLPVWLENSNAAMIEALAFTDTAARIVVMKTSLISIWLLKEEL